MSTQRSRFTAHPPPRHAVREEALEDGQPRTLTPKNPGIRVGGILLMVFGVLLWIAGSRYTLMGWHYGLNWFMAWLGLPAQLPPIVSYGVLLALPVGLLYSLVELRRPWTYRIKERDALVLYWIIWVLIVVSDVGSTFLGVKQPGVGATRLAQQVAANDGAAALWSLFLTFIPEWFILGARKLFRR